MDPRWHWRQFWLQVIPRPTRTVAGGATGRRKSLFD